MKKSKIVKLAISTSKGSVTIGNFKGTLDREVNFYYNIDLGRHKQAMYDTAQKRYINTGNIHFSLHASGQGHLKSQKGIEKLQKGNLSDGSLLLNNKEDLTIIGIESFNLERAPSFSSFDPNHIILNPTATFSSFSILWLLVHSSYPDTIPNRIMWIKLWGYEKNLYRVQTASLDDILITPRTQTVLSLEGWNIRACFLKSLLPIFHMPKKDITLLHPKGQELPWRAFTFVDAHLPLSHIIKSEALRKPIILTSDKPLVSKASAAPTAWVKWAD